MLNLVSDHRNTKKMHKNAVKKFLFVIRYVTDQ